MHIMHMILRSIPEPAEVLADLHDLAPLVWGALEAGVDHTRWYFSEFRGPEVSLDPYLAAHLTRNIAGEYLMKRQQDVEFEPEPLANSGIIIRATRNACRYEIRVRRALDGRLPTSQSKTMLDFCRQTLLPFKEIEPTKAPFLNVIFLWETPKAYTHVSSVILACPEVGAKVRDEVHAHWYAPVPHPIATAVPAQAGEDGVTAPDLDIAPAAVPKTGTGEGK